MLRFISGWGGEANPLTLLPQLSAHPGLSKDHPFDPRGWALNRAAEPIDVLLCPVIVQWALG